MTTASAILIIDDDQVLTELYRSKFEKEGYAVTVCHDGQQGFDTLRGGLKPDVIVLDLMMPVMDGITFLREASYKLRLPPIIVMTSQDQDAKKLEALIHGAHAYVIKAQVTPMDLLEQIRLLLSPQGTRKS